MLFQTVPEIGVLPSGVTESLFGGGEGGGGAKGMTRDSSEGGWEVKRTASQLFFSITFIVHNQKSNGEGGGGLWGTHSKHGNSRLSDPSRS